MEQEKYATGKPIFADTSIPDSTFYVARSIESFSNSKFKRENI